MPNIAILEKFDEKPSCAKCGDTDVQFAHAERKKIYDSVADYYAERIICKCMRCRYVWLMACKDSQQTTESGGGNIEPLIAGAKALANSLAPNRKKDGKCHAHCQVGCDYKVCGTCTYNGDDGCEGQYIRTKPTGDNAND